jgi:TolB-like protein
MASLIPGFEYDIFISYRHKDNKGGHWVTEFVDALRTELEATFKEDISIYFDENPYDGVLETHNVDKSLEGKLKCLIFIPIISQTYCDLKSFAWQHEFCAFNKTAKEDQFGRDIKLANGNVASRILPVKIHELDAEDNVLLELELGGALRAIEFIFKTPGVNRPLRAHEDHPHDNLNKTFYPDQINKVANATKEIISSLRHPLPNAPRTGNPSASQQPTINPTTNNKRTIASFTVLSLFAIAGFFLYSKIFPTLEVEGETDKSIAVLPFTDVSETHDQAYFSDGMMIEILDHLFKIKGLRIIPRNSTLSFKNSSKPLKEIASELGVAHLIQGSVRKSGNRVKISVQLISGNDERFLWQETYDRELSDVFAVQSDVASQIANALKANITPDVKKRMDAIPTQNQEAYDLYLQGQQEYLKFWTDFNSSHARDGIEYLEKAVSLDSTFSDAFAGLGRCYWFLATYAPDYTTKYWHRAREYLNKAIELDPRNGWAYAQLGVVQHNGDWDKKGASRSLQKALELSPSDNSINNELFWFYLQSQNCDSMNVFLDKMKEIEPMDYYEYEIAIKICNGQDRDLRAINPPNDISYPVVLWFELERLLIVNKYQRALELVEQYEDLWSKDFYLVAKGEALGLVGKRAEALEIIREIENLSKTQRIRPSNFAIVYMAIGDENKAYEYLEKGIEERGIWLHMLPYSASFYNKRNDPRFQAFMKRTWVN